MVSPPLCEYRTPRERLTPIGATGIKLDTMRTRALLATTWLVATALLVGCASSGPVAATKEAR
jgi:hypothetical protein